jgi:putative ABC transport system substrate-binding protein
MDRRAFITIVSASILAAPLAGEAQQPGKVYRVGILTNQVTDPAEARLWQAFRSGLRECGWIEGQNIVVEFRAAEGDTARLPELAADLVRLKVDLIVARSSTFVQAAKEATPSIPIVFLIHADPVGTGHVTSLARPGGNITGLIAMMTVLRVMLHTRRSAEAWAQVKAESKASRRAAARSDARSGLTK